jgi:hypothetical protein
MFFAGDHAILDKIKEEQDRWIYLSLKLSLLVFQVRYKKKQNGFYRSLSSGGGGTIMRENNFTWFNKTFDQGFYRSSISGTFVEQHYFFRVVDVSKLNLTNRLLLIRTKKLGAFNVEINDLDSINYADLKLLSSSNSLSVYQKVLKTYLG